MTRSTDVFFEAPYSEEVYLLVKKLLAFALALSLAAGGVTLPAVSVKASVPDESVTVSEESDPGSEVIESTAEETAEADETAAESVESALAAEESLSSEPKIIEGTDSVPEESLEEETESAEPLPEDDSVSEDESSGLTDESTGLTDESTAELPEETESAEEESEAADPLSDEETAPDESTGEKNDEEILSEAEEISAVGTKAPFAEGDYYICSAINENAVFDIEGGMKRNGVNLQLYKSNGSDAQKFHVAFGADGTATITALHSGKALDAAGRGTALKTNVWQYTANGTPAQSWVITESALEGFYTIKASYTNLVMDAAGGSSANKTNIQLYAPNNTKAQQWKFVPVVPVEEPVSEPAEPQVVPASLKTGYYKIFMAKNANRCIEVQNGSFEEDANIAVGPNSQKAAQVFYLTNLGDGWYTMESCLTGFMFAAKSTSTANGTNIEQKKKSSEKTQRWYIKECEGLYTICSGVNNGVVVDVSGALTGIGTNIRLYQSNDTIAQKWTFKPVSAPNAVLPGGNYVISCAANPNIVVSIPSGTASKGSNAALATYKGNNYQKFIVTALGDGTYKLIVAGSAMALDVAGGARTNGGNLQQYSYNGTTAQRWRIVGCRGVYKIIGVGSGKAIDATGGKIAAGTNLQIYTDNGTAAQQFTFSPAVIMAENNVVITNENGKTYAVDPATGKKFQIEPEYLNDPRVGVDVTEDDFFAAVLYTEAGGQGIDGMMMVAYVINNRMAKGIEAARTGAYVEYPGTLDIMIYQKEQWQVARTKDNGDPAPLGNVLRDIVNGTADYLSRARTVVAKANNRDDIVLEHTATVYTRTGANSSTRSTMPVGTHIKASAFTYNSFMTPKAWLRYCQDGRHTKFKANYQGNNAFLYSGAVTSQGHVFFYDEDVW